MRLPWKNILITLLTLLVAAAAYIFWPVTPDLAHLASVSEKYDATILRDTWGVPHIYGQTDADTAYGLAYAHAEDDFLTIQQTAAAARGQLALIYGPDAAPNDYIVQLLRIWDVVEAEYHTLMPETRALLTAYADGLNHYAALHPDKVLHPALFPLTGQDIAAASVHKSPLFFGLDGTLGNLFGDERPEDVSPRPGATGSLQFFFAGIDTLLQAGVSRGDNGRYGSNTFAIAPSRTPDGSTYLAVNAHQPWSGPVTWYEAHVHSEEGWDMTGAVFPGTPVIVHGHNRDLGWAFTVNHPDLIDIYVLDINPENPNQYRFDGEWLDLEVRAAPIKVNLVGRFNWTVKEEVLWSVYGPVVRRDHGTYAIRYAGYGRVDIFEQLYRMNKATNFDEWRTAIAGGGLPNFNVGYADKEGNIYYLYNGMLPVRAEGYQWDMYLPGDTSETLWTEYLPFEQLPQAFNPPSGFVQNANSSPFQATLGPGNPELAAYSPTLGIETFMTNRALRALELFGADESITFDEFIAYKYDTAYSPASDVAVYRDALLNADLPDDPDLLAAADILRAWDLHTDTESAGASLMVLTLKFLLEKDNDINASQMVGEEVDTAQLVESFTQAVDALKTHFGRVDVRWGDVNRLRRGTLDLSIDGGPDTLRATYGSYGEDGRFEAFNGDGYMLLVRWHPDGGVESYSLHQFGSATLDETSCHYADQSAFFVVGELKTAWFDEADIRANLEQEYKPGEPRRKVNGELYD